MAGRSNQGVRSNYTVGTVILQAIQYRIAINTLFETGMELMHTLRVTAPLREGGKIQIFRLRRNTLPSSSWAGLLSNNAVHFS